MDNNKKIKYGEPILTGTEDDRCYGSIFEETVQLK